MFSLKNYFKENIYFQKNLVGNKHCIKYEISLKYCDLLKRMLQILVLNAFLWIVLILLIKELTTLFLFVMSLIHFWCQLHYLSYKETLTLIPTVGIQEITYFASGRTSLKFYALNNVKNFIMTESITMIKTTLHLCILYEYQNELISKVLFSTTIPKYEILKLIYKDSISNFKSKF